MREWPSLWHFPQVKGVAGLSSCVAFSPLKREIPFFTSRFQVDLSAAAASQVLGCCPCREGLLRA